MVVFSCQHVFFEEDLLKLMAQQLQRTGGGGGAQANTQQQQLQFELLQEKMRNTAYYCPTCKQNSENNSKSDRRKTRK